MEKRFKVGLVLGRFQPIHNGHKQIIDFSRQLCEKTLVLIGSSQESGTLRNPFSAELRKRAISRVYPKEDVVVGTLADMTNENDISVEWGKYILKNIRNTYDVQPDLMLYGKDESRKGWFSEEDSQKFSEIIVARNKIEISATTVREYMVKDQKEIWKQHVPVEIWKLYDELREELLKLECYQK